MKIDLLHNKIVKDTVSPLFVESFMEGLVPLFEDRYGDSLVEIQMYEDYLSDGFIDGGEFYYPLTLVFDDEVRREWIKWSVAEKKRFKRGVPYSYTGKELLSFKIATTVPEGFAEKLEGRGIYFEGGYVPLNIETTAEDVLFLAGKYSQTFIDEMARQISRQIESAFSISGLADSTVAFTLVFAPGTFMEHTADGFVYRRLLITAKGCGARDMWIKWNKNSSVNCVTFELGEDVPHKIREKEYRYLVHSSTDEYQAAMGRKNVTEWRGLIKRIIKRGEVESAEVISVDPEKQSELTFKLQEVLGFSSPAEAVTPEVKKNDNDDLDALLRGVLGVQGPEKESVNTYEDCFVLEETPTFEEKLEEPISDSGCFESKEETHKAPTVTESYEDELRRKIEAEIREKLEAEAREKAEAEALYLRRAHEELLAENERLAEVARKAEAEKLAAEAERIAEAEKLRIELESRERAEAREKERLAEAARIAIMEQQRLMEARAEEEKRRAEEEERIREEKRIAEEEARLAEARIREEQRIRLEMEMRAQQAARAEAAAKAAEAQKAAEAEAEKVKEPEYTYVSKVAKLLFRYAVDPNITKRIHEIILTTIKYFHKEDVYIKIRATVPDTTTVHLYFDKIPAEENELLINIIKVLGKSDLGITKVYLE